MVDQAKQAQANTELKLKIACQTVNKKKKNPLLDRK